ncbi:hypothetical protein ACN6MT_20125 [Neobacillus niacini]|uniref:hypothetical protein n=1 Tax=Neobacillus niacini TaxID=86668 RepID=UPI003B0218BD
MIFKQLNQLRTMEEHKIWLLEKIGKLVDYLSDNQKAQKAKLLHEVKNYLKSLNRLIVCQNYDSLFRQS